MIIYYFLPAIIFLGIITSYEDIKFGKIRNKWVLGAIAFAVIANLVLFFAGAVSGREITMLAINFAVTVGASFVLWNFKFWSAGDGKLFIAYAALIPVGYYTSPLVGFFPSFNLFVNVIVLFFIYLVIKNIFLLKKKETRIKIYENAKDLPVLLISIFSVSWLAKLAGAGFNLNNIVYSFILYAAIYAVVNLLVSKFLSFFKIKIISPIHIYLLLILARVIFDFGSILNVNLIVAVLISALVYSFFLRTLYDCVSENFVKTIPVGRLKPGDIIFNREEKEEQGKKKTNRFEGEMAEGLTSAEVKKIKAICSRKKIKTISITETTYFAPALFAGVGITLVFGNIANIIYLLVALFQMLMGVF